MDTFCELSLEDGGDLRTVATACWRPWISSDGYMQQGGSDGWSDGGVMTPSAMAFAASTIKAGVDAARQQHGSGSRHATSVHYDFGQILFIALKCVAPVGIPTWAAAQ
jgi:hypothetical protein